MCKRTVEEVPNNEQANGGPSLPEGANSLLMTEKEYLDTLSKGEKGEPPMEITMEKPNNNQKAQCKHLRYIEPEIQECQPTSSKVKVKDLVMDDQEEQAHIDEDKQQPATKIQSFWDRPIPKPQFDWPYDPRMPPEWNEEVMAM